MNGPLIYYWSGNTGGTQALCEKLSLPTQRLHRHYYIDTPYILVAPSYGSPVTGGYVPKEVVTFLAYNHEYMVGVIGAGNRNFGEDFCKGAHMISEQYDVPVLHRVELRGTDHDVETINNGTWNHWGKLKRMKGL